MMALTRWVEIWGNRLPNPVLLFLWFWLGIVLIAQVAVWFGVGVQHPASNEWVAVRSVLSFDGFSWWLNNAIRSFTNFAPVGPVLTVMLGIGIAERSGYLKALLLRLLPRNASSWLTMLVVLVGVLSSLAFDAGYVVVLPLSAFIFHMVGRSPLLGIAAAFAAVSGGYSANIMIGPVDFMLSGLSSEAAQLIEPARQVAATANWYFMAASVVMLTITITTVVEKYLAPQFLPEKDSIETPSVSEPLSTAMSASEQTAFSWASGILLVYLLLIGSMMMELVSGMIPDSLSTALIKNLSILIGVGFLIAGTVYGRCLNRYGADQWVQDLEETWRQLVPYLVLMFFAAQFVTTFGWTQLGLALAVVGAEVLTQFQTNTPILMLGLILMTALINLLVGSASAKWALLAPVFVPMLMLLGVEPEVTQVAYRIGDSSTNIITPLMPYFPLILVLMQRYQPDAGIGTLLAMMLPLALTMLLIWSLMLCIWLLLGWPLGPVSG